MTGIAEAHLASVVTYLEMRERPRPRPMPASPLRLIRWTEIAPDRYRVLFRRVGSRWLWFSRLLLSDEDLARTINSAVTEVYAVVDRGGIEVGMLELDFDLPGQCEIAFFGLVPELAGQGHGRWLMSHALALGWRAGVERIWVHTCTLDHPSALGFYRAQGFRPYAQGIETFADPRLAGVLPIGVAPQIPLLGSAN